MYPGPPSPPWEDGASLDLPRKCAFCLTVILGRHLGYRAVPFAHRDITPFSGHCLLIAMEVQVVLPATVPGLVLPGKAAVKRDSLVVLDFGLDVFCQIADSWSSSQLSVHVTAFGWHCLRPESGSGDVFAWPPQLPDLLPWDFFC